MRLRHFAVKVFPLAVAAACLAVRTERGFFIDEYTTWRVASLPPGEMIRDRFANGHFPTYFAIVAGWIRIAGDSVTAMRLPSMACALASVAVFHALARELCSRRTARLAALLFATHQLALWAGQTARPYAMGLLATLLAAWGVVKWWRADAASSTSAAAGMGRWKWLSLAAGGSAATVATQALGALPLASVALALAPIAVGRGVAAGTSQTAAGARWRARIAIAALLLPMLAMSVPVAVLAKRQAKIHAPGRQPMRLPRIDGFVTAIGDNAFGELETWSGGPARYAGAALFGGLLWAGGALSGRRKRGERAARVGFASSPAGRAGFPVRAAAIWWFAAPPVALALAECVTRASLVAQNRYHIPGLPGAVLLTAMGLRALAANPATRRVAAPAAAAAVIALQAGATAAHWLSDGDGPRAVARAMVAVAPPRTPVLGDIHPLRYEFRAELPPLIDLKDLPTSETRARATSALAAAPGRLAWVFVYNNKREKRAALTALFTTPPAGYRAGRRIDHADATAVLLSPEK